MAIRTAPMASTRVFTAPSSSRAGDLANYTPHRLILRSAVLQGEIVLDDLAALHHEFHPLQFGDIRQRIARDGDEIGELAFLHRANLVLPAEGLGVYHRAALDGARGAHAGMLHEHFKFERLGAVGEG